MSRPTIATVVFLVAVFWMASCGIQEEPDPLSPVGTHTTTETTPSPSLARLWFPQVGLAL